MVRFSRRGPESGDSQLIYTAIPDPTAPQIALAT